MRKAELVPWIGFAVRLLAAGIWLAAGVAKVADLAHFRDQVAAYDVLPHALVGPFAYALPFVEIVLGLYLLVGLWIRPVAIVACVLMLVFIAAQAQAWYRGLVLDCGCFGTISQQKVGPLTILRDAALGLPSLAMAIWPARKLSLDATWLGRPDRFAIGDS
ncbi:MAG TPA: MauE/DoxX family redox-associated membrane protein [Gaiellaceae bacterium]|nr:MauE/DoxX family redox-associated membrane protein [Gaiellaceae bacterium]